MEEDVYVLGMIGAAGDLHSKDVLNRQHLKDSPDFILHKAVQSLVRTIEVTLEYALEQMQTNIIFKHQVSEVCLQSEVGRGCRKRMDKWYESVRYYLGVDAGNRTVVLIVIYH